MNRRRFPTAAVSILIVAALSVAADDASGQAPRPVRKVFISADLEGVAGVVGPAQLGTTGFEYGKAREWVTGEVNAAIEGARAAGATEFVVCDAHGNAQNLLIDQLPSDVRIARGSPRPLEMMQGIDETFDAALLIGYHASEWSVNAVRSHTISSARLLGIHLNGAEVMEAVFNAGIAGHFGVPVVFLSGDRVAVAQFLKSIPAAEGVVLKEPYGYHSALTVTPAAARQLIRDGVTRAIRKAGEVPPLKIKTPVALEVGFKATIDAERAAYIPGLARLDTHRVGGTFADMLQVTRLIQILTSLEPPQ